MNQLTIQIRDAKPEEFAILGRLMVEVYAQLEGFPSPKEQPAYYYMLENIGDLTKKPQTRLLVAVSQNNEVVGGLVYFSDMKYYGSGGTATKEKNSAGFRLLAVGNKNRGQGIGKQLTQACINIAKEENQQQLIIHSTKAMQIAWKMYEKLGFIRYSKIDFIQEKLPVFGFRILL